ncbi:MAG: hypothetical protein AAGN35_09985 [Bacteroidota bacterium]
MYKILTIAALLGFFGTPTFATSNPVPVTVLNLDIPQATLHRLFGQAAELWDTTADILDQDYQDGRLLVKPLGGDQYELTWTTPGGIAIISVLEDAGA